MCRFGDILFFWKSFLSGANTEVYYTTLQADEVIIPSSVPGGSPYVPAWESGPSSPSRQSSVIGNK